MLALSLPVAGRWLMMGVSVAGGCLMADDSIRGRWWIHTFCPHHTTSKNMASHKTKIGSWRASEKRSCRDGARAPS